MEIEVAFRLSRSEYVRALRFCLRKRHLVSWVPLLVIAVALALSVVMALLMERVSFLCTMILVLAVMLAVYSLYQYLLKPGRIFDRDPMLHRDIRFRFTGEDIARQDSETAVLLDWRVSKVWRNRDFYFLFEGKESYILLPRRAFGSAEEEKRFERLVLEANPGVAWRNFG